MATQVVSGFTFDPPARTDYLLTTFVQDEITLVSDRLSLILGSRFLRTNFARFQAEPSVRLMWTPHKKHAIWTSHTRAVRTPSRVERDFQTETLNGLDLGYRTLLIPNLFIDIASFYNRYNDLFSQNITGAPYLETTPNQRTSCCPLSSGIPSTAPPPVSKWHPSGGLERGGDSRAPGPFSTSISGPGREPARWAPLPRPKAPARPVRW